MLFRSQQQRNKKPSIAPGIDAEVLSHQGTTCDQHADTCRYNGGDGPFMKELLNSKGLVAVFAAHNHAVDWCMRWSSESRFGSSAKAQRGRKGVKGGSDGINMCFGRRTGYGGYNKKFAKGARKIVVYEDGVGNAEKKGKVETWIRLEDRRVEGRVSLNATFGVDGYPAVSDGGR